MYRSYIPYSLGFCLSLEEKLKFLFIRRNSFEVYFGLGNFGCGKNLNLLIMGIMGLGLC